MTQNINALIDNNTCFLVPLHVGKHNIEYR